MFFRKAALSLELNHETALSWRGGKKTCRTSASQTSDNYPINGVFALISPDGKLTWTERLVVIRAATRKS
jgi:hypothetical protein